MKSENSRIFFAVNANGKGVMFSRLLIGFLMAAGYVGPERLEDVLKTASGMDVVRKVVCTDKTCMLGEIDGAADRMAGAGTVSAVFLDLGKDAAGLSARIEIYTAGKISDGLKLLEALTGVESGRNKPDTAVSTGTDGLSWAQFSCGRHAVRIMAAERSFDAKIVGAVKNSLEKYLSLPDANDGGINGVSRINLKTPGLPAEGGKK